MPAQESPPLRTAPRAPEPPSPPARKSRGARHGLLQRAVGIALILASIGFLAFAMGKSEGGPAHRDFIYYWSAGQLLRHHKNPYDSAQTQPLFQAQGSNLRQSLIMRNPPWALFLVWPLGFSGAVTGALAWTLGILATTMISVALLRRRDSNEHIFTYFFAPVLACMMVGQTSAFLLLGCALFLRLEKRRQFWAGAALLLMAIKPHLFVPFSLIVCCDSLRRRRAAVFAGFLCAISLATALAFLAEPHIWADYLRAMREEHIENLFVQTPSYLLRALVDPAAKWLQFLPCMLGSAWAAWYYVRHRREWQWGSEGLLVLAVSVMVSPYGTLTDEIVLIPAVLAGIYGGRRASLEIFIGINALIALLAILHFSITSGAYIWTGTAWLLWFLYARRGTPGTVAQAAAPA